jgi:hydroxymethylpyrimidine pyrophosphatase-like HAD family hydrolase
LLATVRLNPEVRRAITDVREHGITVAIVTGRILDAARHFSFGKQAV